MAREDGDAAGGGAPAALAGGGGGDFAGGDGGGDVVGDGVGEFEYAVELGGEGLEVFGAVDAEADAVGEWLDRPAGRRWRSGPGRRGRTRRRSRAGRW